jgi:hypothetical protein
MRRQTTRNPKTENAAAPLPQCLLKRPFQLRATSAANHGYPWAGHDACFECKSRHRYEVRFNQATHLKPPDRKNHGESASRQIPRPGLRPTQN